MKTLEQILKETAKAKNDGEFGITACKESIKFALEYTQERMRKATAYRARTFATPPKQTAVPKKTKG